MAALELKLFVQYYGAKLSTPVVIIRSDIEYLSIIGCYLCNIKCQ